MNWEVFNLPTGKIYLVTRTMKPRILLLSLLAVMEPAGKLSKGRYISILVLVGLLLFSGCSKNPSAPKDAVQTSPISTASSTTTDGGNREAGSNRLAWNLRTLPEAYDKTGSKNHAWDEPARKALDGFARLRSAEGRGDETLSQLVATNCAAAVAAGCDDPMIAYLNARYVLASREISGTELAYALTNAAEKLVGSGYPTVRKFYAALRAAEQLKFVAGTNTPPEVHRFRRIAVSNLKQALDDRTMPIQEVDDACGDMFRALELNSAAYEESYRGIEKLLFKNWPEESVSWLLKGKFYFKYAWMARGSGYSDSVTEEGWKLMRERLEVAEEALNHAWKLNPRDARIPVVMIDVELGQGRGRQFMETWFQRGMAVDTNNYDACQVKRNYLEPKWYGSAGEMLAFGRECVHSKEWGGRVPLVLSDAHEALARYLNRPDRPAYWKRPEVWPDIKSSFDRFFQLNPDAVGWYHNYALFAYRCEQWEKLNELVPKLGRVNFDYFGGKDEYEKMVRLAREKSRTPDGNRELNAVGFQEPRIDANPVPNDRQPVSQVGSRSKPKTERTEN